MAQLAYRLNLARPKVAEECRRPIAIGLQDDDVKTSLKGADFCEFSSGIFEFHNAIPG